MELLLPLELICHWNFVAVGTFVAIGPVVANNEVRFGYVETTINILPKART